MDTPALNPAARPCQFSADSGRIKPRPCRGQEVGFQLFIFFRPPSARRRRAPVRHRTAIGGGSENRASVALSPASPLSRFPLPPVSCWLSRARCAGFRSGEARGDGRRTDSGFEIKKNEN